jgi:hypothetical protein
MGKHSRHYTDLNPLNPKLATTPSPVYVNGFLTASKLRQLLVLAQGQWSARKAQVMAKRYKAAGGGYRD